jgi:hypothetical protein
MRAVAEITKLGGFRGAVSIEHDAEPYRLYRACLDQIYSQQTFRSVLSASICSAAEGWFGNVVPTEVRARLRGSSTLYLWPLMAMLWAFDCAVVAKRSRLVAALVNADSVADNNAALASLRNECLVAEKLLGVERFPEPVGFFVEPPKCWKCEYRESNSKFSKKK